MKRSDDRAMTTIRLSAPAKAAIAYIRGDSRRSMTDIVNSALIEAARRLGWSLRVQAVERVRASRILRAHERLLLDYDWPNEEDHLLWIASAPEREIADWARSIEADETEDRKDEEAPHGR